MLVYSAIPSAMMPESENVELHQVGSGEILKIVDSLGRGV